MALTRRRFIGQGIAAFAVSMTVPSFVRDLARAQGAASSRSLVILDLTGGNDGLSTLIPYNDPYYYSRRPTIGVPAGTVLQIGSDSAKNDLGLHPKLGGLRSIFNEGRLAVIQRVGYENSSRSHFTGGDIWATANPANSQTSGWLGRYLASTGANLDPLVAWNTTGDTPHAMQASGVSVASIPSLNGFTFSSPNGGTDAGFARTAAASLASHVPVDRPQLGFVASSIQSAMATLDRVAVVGQNRPTVTYPTDGLSQALQAVAGAMVKQTGTRVFWVQTGGFDTHASQDPNGDTGAYARLMTTLNGGLSAFYNDLRNTGLLADALVLTFSEFGRRISENGSRGTDHGAASVMFAMGGGVRGGIYGTAASLNPDPKNPTLENSAGDVHYETDFRAVYANVIDNWLGGDSVAVLGANFRKQGPAFL